MLNYDPEALPYEDGDSMKLKRLELAIDYKQKAVSCDSRGPSCLYILSETW
jgi:hypothetical protein